MTVASCNEISETSPVTADPRVFPPYLQSAHVLHEKAFLINRPAPLEFDKNRGEKDLINPRSF